MSIKMTDGMELGRRMIEGGSLKENAEELILTGGIGA
jgi:hypothetical protein